MPQTVDEYFAALPASQADIAAELRRLILGTHPAIQEALKWGMPVYEHKGQLCYLKAAKAHLTFGFERGAQLADPEGLLQGEGKQMRHVKLRRPEDVRTEQFRAWLQQAVQLNEA